MKFAKKISTLALASIILSTNFTFISNADTINKNSNSTTLSINARAKISKDKAKQIMLNKVGGGKIVEFSSDYDDGILIYEGKVISGNYEYEIEVHGNTGKVIKFEKDYRDYDDDYGNIGNTGSNNNTGNTGSSVSKKLIGETKARQIMLNKVPNGKIVYITLEYDDGVPEYEGKVVKGNREYEITVHGYTGGILDFESESRYDYTNSSSTNSNISANLIGESRAKQIMLNKVPGATIRKFCLDLDDRIPEYKGELVKGYREYEISVHAITGNIIDYSSEMFDDALGHWAENTIFEFYNKGYINGYSDNSFQPNGNITRAEFVKILNKYFNLTKAKGKVFNDTINHWAKNEIDIAVSNGICQGVSSTEFRPNDPITREQAAVMIANYLGINTKNKNYDKMSKFQDKNEVSSWAKDAIEALLDRGYLNGTSTTTIGARDNTTRAQSVTLLSRVSR